MATPAFLQFAKQYTGSPIPGAIESGLKTYGALQDFERKKASEKRADAVEKRAESESALKQQAQKLNLEALPGQLEAQRKESSLKREGMVHTNALGKLNLEQTKHTLYGHGLADVMETPIEQRPEAYQHLRTKMMGLGYDESHMPEEYNEKVEAQAKIAAAHTPEAAEHRKFLNNVMLERIKNEGKLGVARAKAVAPTSPEQKAYGEAEGKANSKYATAISEGADRGEGLKGSVEQIMGPAGKIPSKFGLVRGNMIKLTEEGQLAAARMQKLVLTLFGDMKHIGRGGQLLIKTIMESKLSPNMTYAALKKFANSYRSLAAYAIQKNNFMWYMKKKGIHDRNQIQRIWSKFNEKYPAMTKNDVDPSQALKWPKFLKDNPRFVGGKTKKEEDKYNEGLDLPSGTDF